MLTADYIRLRHLLDAARKAIAFMHGRTLTDLESDEMRALTVIQLLQIAGEAAKRVSDETRARYPSVPWRQVAGTRDRLIHGYFEVDLELVWSIVSQDLPELVAQIEAILAKEQ